MASLGAPAQARSPRALPAELAEAIRTSAGISIGTSGLRAAPSTAATAAPVIRARSVSAVEEVAPASAYLLSAEDGGLAQTVLPVTPALAGLLPDKGLRRGTVISVVGSSSLVLALLAEASAQGSWCAEIGSPLLGSAAAAEAGIALDRFVRVPAPAESWAEAAAALVDGFDLVVLHPPAFKPAASKPLVNRSQQMLGIDRITRRLAARARERGTVLVVTGAWEGAALRLTVTTRRWHGIGAGYGHLSAREVEVGAVGRGSAVRPRQVRLWLPGPDGRVAAVEPDVPAMPLGEQESEPKIETAPAAVLSPDRLAG